MTSTIRSAAGNVIVEISASVSTNSRSVIASGTSTSFHVAIGVVSWNRVTSMLTGTPTPTVGANVVRVRAAVVGVVNLGASTVGAKAVRVNVAVDGVTSRGANTVGANAVKVRLAVVGVTVGLDTSGI